MHPVHPYHYIGADSSKSGALQNQFPFQSSDKWIHLFDDVIVLCRGMMVWYAKITFPDLLQSHVLSDHKQVIVAGKIYCWKLYSILKGVVEDGS